MKEKKSKTLAYQESLLILSSLVILLIGCEHGQPMKKPFIIVAKHNYPYSTGKLTRYVYEDAVGRDYGFDDSTGKYNVGDTLK